MIHASLISILANTCQDVQTLYETSKCCDSPDTHMIPKCDAVKFQKATIAGKLKYTYGGCIDADEDSEDCPSGSRSKFLNGLWKLRTEGNPDSTISSSGTRSEQLYKEVEEIMYHEGKRSSLMSSAAIDRENSNNGKATLYPMAHPLTTATMYLQMTYSLPMIDKVYPKLNDKVNRFIPQWSKAERNSKKLLKFNRNFMTGSATVGTYTYADFNVYGFMKMQAQNDGSNCIISELPSGKTADIECGLSSNATLETTPVNNGVLEVKTNPETPMTLSAATQLYLKTNVFVINPQTRQPVSSRVFGIHLDLEETDLENGVHPHDLENMGYADKYTDDPTCAMTYIVDIGPEATKYQAGGSDGYRFMNKVVQFCIRPQKTEMTMRDLLSGKAGFDETMSHPRFQIDYPGRYQRIALAGMLNRDAIEATRYTDKPQIFYHRYSTGMKGLDFTDARFVREIGNSVLSFEPGSEYGGDNASPVMAAAIITLLEDAISSTDFPVTISGESDFASFDIGKKLTDGTDRVLKTKYYDLLKKYIFGPMGVPDDDYVVTYDGVNDPKLARTPTMYASDVAYTLNPGLVETNMVRALANAQLNATVFPMTPPHPTDRILSWTDVWESDTVNLFLQSAGMNLATPPQNIPPSLINVRELDFLFTRYSTVRMKDGTTSDEYTHLYENRRYYKSSPYFSATASAMEMLMSTLMNNGKTNDGVRIFPCGVIGALSQPMDQTDEQIALTSSYRDPLNSEQSDGRLSITLGMGASGVPSDLNTQTSSALADGASYRFEGTTLTFSKSSQYYNVLVSSTADKQPSWQQEKQWPGATFLWEKLWRQRYSAHLCLPTNI